MAKRTMPLMTLTNCMRQAPEVTIIIPVRNEAANIKAVMDDVLAQVFDTSFEVVVADGRSTDGTATVLERMAAHDDRVRVVDNEHGGTPQGLNCALWNARGRYVLRMDGHAHIGSDYVQRLVDHLRSGTCEGAGGRKRAIGRGQFGRAVAAAHGSRFGIGDSKYHHSRVVELVDHVPFGAYVTQRARDIGGWDETFVRNQDFEFDYRYGLAGGRILLDPSIVAEWSVRETPKALASQYYQYGYWKFRALMRHPSSFHLRWLAPPTLVGVLALGALTAPARPGRLLLGTASTAYGGALSLGAVMLSRSLGPRLGPHAAAALGVMHLSWGTGFLVSAARTAGERVRRKRSFC